MSEEKPKMNFEEIIEEFNKWRERFLEGTIDEAGGFSWGMQDWINWSIDVTDAIVDIYHYLKTMGILFNGFKEVFYNTKGEELPLTNKEEIKKLYT